MVMKRFFLIEFFVLSWSPSLIANLIILSMTLWKSITSQRKFGTVPIMQRMRRDGILYFVVVVVVNCVSFGFAARKSCSFRQFRELTISGDTRPTEQEPSLQIVTLPASIVITSICCSRLVLSLRAHGSEPVVTLRHSSNFVESMNLTRRRRRFGSR